MGRSSVPPSSDLERQSDSARRSVRDAPSHTAPQILAPAAAHAPEITPAQHAPPGSPDRHILISVFRI